MESVKLGWHNVLNTGYRTPGFNDRESFERVTEATGMRFYSRDNLVYRAGYPERVGTMAEMEAGRLWWDPNDGRVVTLPYDLPVKKYVVVEVLWEYNDEYSYPASDHAGFPRKVYDSLGEAGRECDRLNREQVLEVDNPFNLDPYGSHYDNVLSMPWPQFRDWLEDNDVIFPTATEEDPSMVALEYWWSVLSNEEKEKVAQFVTRPFYTVEEVTHVG